jgi:hypothetical protein
MMREKHDLETRYHELFNSYLSMLDHNRALAQKFEAREKSRVRSPEKILERSPTNRPESSVGKIAKNKLKTQSSKKKSKEKSVERHVLARTHENFSVEVRAHLGLIFSKLLVLRIDLFQRRDLLRIKILLHHSEML